MGNIFSSMDSPRVTKNKEPREHRQGMFNYHDGRNIRESYPLTGVNHWVTVFFNGTDSKYSDEELMELVIARIDARDGIVSSEPVHHDVKQCLSLRVPGNWHPGDVSIAATAKIVARCYQTEIRHRGLGINRRYLFRAMNRKNRLTGRRSSGRWRRR